MKRNYRETHEGGSTHSCKHNSWINLLNGISIQQNKPNCKKYEPNWSKYRKYRNFCPNIGTSYIYIGNIGNIGNIGTVGSLISIFVHLLHIEWISLISLLCTKEQL